MGLPKKKQQADNLPQQDYKAFDQLDGQHPWKETIPEGCIEYPARVIKEAKVAYFNFELAKDMGLIPKSHPNELTKALEKKLVATFSIRIINEYDQSHNVKFKPSLTKEHTYMATRYLQLQHMNKQGKTSGDGRCVWNGQVKHRGSVWDVSSRGVGVTALAPGSVDAGKPLESGNTDFGYGCGLAEIDELYSSALMAEIFYNNNIPTERMLVIIDHGNDFGVGVRAGKNLFRPAHLFLYLKQNNLESLKKSVDFIIDQQIQNKEWSFSIKTKKKYESFLKEVCISFAKFAAKLDREYIFSWLDWDGDNVLINAGIIDYGSIRQFGLRHDQYRYDDVERFSTTLNEQKAKARLIVQVFAQMTDFILNENKKTLKEFQNSPTLELFDKEFEQESLNLFLAHFGFDETQIKKLLSSSILSVKKFYRTYSYLEGMKTYKKIEKVDDGVNRPAIYNMRKVCNEYPSSLIENCDNFPRCELEANNFFDLMLAESAEGKDRKMTNYVSKRIMLFQRQYLKLVEKSSSSKDIKSILLKMAELAKVENKERRVTGNALVFVVQELMAAIKKGLNLKEVQGVIDHFIKDHSPTIRKSKDSPKKTSSDKLLKSLSEIVDDYKESI